MDLPVGPLYWLAALAPLAAVLVLLIGLRWKASGAASVGYILAVVLALWLFQASPGNVALHSVKGVWDALFIAYVIVPALLLYEVTDEAGAFHSIRRGIEAITPNSLVHVLAFAWIFPSFLQSVTGFGAPVAVAAPLLVALGVRPVWAVVLPIIGHAWAKTFGTLGVAWEALMRVAPVDDQAMATLMACTMLGLVCLLGGVTIAWLYGRWRGLGEAWPVLLACSAIHALGQAGMAMVAPNLATLVPGAVALLVILVLARTLYARPSKVESSPVMGEERKAAAGGAGATPVKDMPLWLAFGPYALLTVLILAVELVPPIREPLASVRVGLAFPGHETGHGVVTAATPAYSPFSPLVHPGTMLLASCLLSFWYFRARGFIGPGRIDEITVDAVRTSIPTVMALLAFVPLALVMQGSGMTLELAAGLAEIASPTAYALLAPLIGALGGFLMGSNLSANILFGPLQEQAAATLGLHPGIVLAAQTAGAAIGSSIAISAVLLGLGVVGGGQVGDALRKLFPFTLAALVLVALVTLGGVLLLEAG